MFLSGVIRDKLGAEGTVLVDHPLGTKSVR